MKFKRKGGIIQRTFQGASSSLIIEKAEMASPFRSDILRGKVALITGGGSGIGFEIATQFGQHGASIAIMGRRKQVLDSAVATLRSLGISVFVFHSIHFLIISRYFFRTFLIDDQELLVS